MAVNEADNKLMSFPVAKDEDAADEAAPLLPPAKSGVGIEEALDNIGLGFFHFVLILVCGWALASDSVEVLCISFVSPQLKDVSTNPDIALKPNSV